MNTDADDFEEAAWELLGEAADADDGDAMIVLAELAQAAQEDADRCRRRDRRLFEAAEDAANERAAQKEAAGQARLVREFREREEAERLAASKRRREGEQRQRDADARDTAAKELADRSAAADARAKRRAAELAEDEAATNAARKRRIDEERRAEEATARREAEERRLGEVEAKARAAAQPVRQQGPRPESPRSEQHAPRDAGSARPLEAGRAAQQPLRAPPETGTATRDALRVLTAPAARTGSGGADLTGADVLAYRKGRGLTQTQLASEWQVTQGTIAKAEGVPSKALGPSLQAALAGARRK